MLPSTVSLNSSEVLHCLANMVLVTCFDLLSNFIIYCHLVPTLHFFLIIIFVLFIIIHPLIYMFTFENVLGIRKGV